MSHDHGHAHGGGHGHGSQYGPGVELVGRLPEASWQDRWDEIVVDPGVKERLLGHVLFCLTQRSHLSRVKVPVHGLALLAGPPGTGKTTLAHGLANTAARVLAERGVAEQTLFAVIDPHAFPSEFLGESQRAVARLFNQTLPDLAGEGLPVIVLVDEVEALAVARHDASMQTNPVDVHRSTAALLTGLDQLAAHHPEVVVVATTNEPASIDPAVMSRVDVLETFGLPGVVAAERILASTLDEILPAGHAFGAAQVRELAESCVERGLDARQIRKLVVRAVVGSGIDVALAPDRLAPAHLAAALS